MPAPRCSEDTDRVREKTGCGRGMEIRRCRNIQARVYAFTMKALHLLFGFNMCFCYQLPVHAGLEGTI